MENAPRIKVLILISLIAVGIFVWVIAPSTMNSDIINIARGAEDEVTPPPEPEEEGFQPDEELLADIAAGYLILVNKSHAVEREYKPEDLTSIKYYASDRSADGRYMRAAASDAFHRLVEAAKEQGHTLVMTTAYRSYEFQSVLYNNYVANEGQAAADRFSAQPGKSEHQTGLAVDISSPGVDYQLVLKFGQTEEGKWVSANAHLFGFIIRFPEGKEDITGYMYEPWHLRYVGMSAAKYIYENEITLEEYLEVIK